MIIEHVGGPIDPTTLETVTSVDQIQPGKWVNFVGNAAVAAPEVAPETSTQPQEG